jgi:hypothetical protein
MNEQLNIILIHGQGRSPWSMKLLGRRLRPYPAHYFGYACWRRSFDEVVARFERRLRSTVTGKPYLIVAHSLGGIITRATLPKLTDMLPRHLVMLAPPNQPPSLAKNMQANWLYRLVTADCGQKLVSTEFYERLPLPGVPTTIIAGTKGLPDFLGQFGDKLNDTVLAIDETKLDGVDDVRLVPAVHAFIMNRPQVAEIILEIIDQLAA